MRIDLHTHSSVSDGTETPAALVATAAAAGLDVVAITDLTWKETFWGQVLGYGTFRFESAGQQQGLDVIDFMPHADALYKRLSELMFGTDFSTNPVSVDEDADGSMAADDRGDGDGLWAGGGDGPGRDVRQCGPRWPLLVNAGWA